MVFILQKQNTQNAGSKYKSRVLGISLNMPPSGRVDRLLRKRNRKTLVCVNCKKRKSKCDRGHPCNTCIRLGDAISCVYLSTHVNKIKSVPYHTQSDDTELNKSPIEHETTQSVPHPLEIESILNQTPPLSNMTSDITRLDEIQGHMGPLISSKTSRYVDNDIKYMVDFIPWGDYIETKRSAITLYSLFSDLSMEHRDPYLRSMVRFRSIAIKNTMRKFQDTTKQKGFNPNLPNSFIPLSTFDRDDIENSKKNGSNVKPSYQNHRHLFEKFANYRKSSKLKYSDDEFVTMIHIPDRNLFMDRIMPIFMTHILELIPLFDINILQNEINVLYDNIDKTKKINIKNFDHMVYSIVLLMTLLVQLSLKFQRTSLTHFESILEVDTSKYMAIVSHFVFQIKVLRKCNLLQLQCLMLLRFYHWCAPEDGDGAEAQHNQVLMGTIISSAKEIGISWKSFTNNKHFFKVADGTRPSLPIMKPDDYEELYKSIWLVILYWDRKMGLINGQEYFITKSFPLNLNSFNHFQSWYIKPIYVDSLMLKINDILSDEPSNIDINLLEDLFSRLKNEFVNIKSSNPGVKYQFKNPLDFEFEWMLDLFKLSITHAKMVSFEDTVNIVKYHESAQQLWDQIVHVSQKCYTYFYEIHKTELNLFNRFYTNRIVEIVANKVCVLIPSFILRFSRMMQVTYDTRKLICKFLFSVSSMYFNEFSSDYYRCFKKMFTAKISYKILDRPENKDPWEIILRFLVEELNLRGRNGAVNYSPTDTPLCELLPLISKLSRYYENDHNTKNRKDFVDIWNKEIYPIGRFDTNLNLNFREEILSSFLNDRYSGGSNLFASFYDNTSFKLSENVDHFLKTNQKNKKDENAKKPLESETITDLTQTSLESLDVPSMYSLSGLIKCVTGTTDTSPNIHDLGESIDSLSEIITEGNLELLNDIFDPLDFISYFN